MSDSGGNGSSGVGSGDGFGGNVTTFATAGQVIASHEGLAQSQFDAAAHEGWHFDYAAVSPTGRSTNYVVAPDWAISEYSTLDAKPDFDRAAPDRETKHSKPAPALTMEPPGMAGMRVNHVAASNKERGIDPDKLPKIPAQEIASPELDQQQALRAKFKAHMAKRSKEKFNEKSLGEGY